MPSGGSWTASQDTRTDVVLMAETITPFTLANGEEVASYDMEYDNVVTTRRTSTFFQAYQPLNHTTL